MERQNSSMSANRSNLPQKAGDSKTLLQNNPLLQQIFSIALDNEKTLIYAPLKGLAFIANAALVNALVDECALPLPAQPYNINPHLKFLHDLDFFNPASQPMDEYAVQGVCYDTVILFLTNQCNLRCQYCYASSGEFSPKSMKWEVAKAAIDRVVDDILARKGTHLTLGFHGGGEPTMNWKILTKATDYARGQAVKHGLTISVAGAFNGYWPEEVRQYMIANFTDISLSFDGLPEIQNQQRPAVGQKGSFDRVLRTLQCLDQANFTYGIRMTVTRQYVGQLAKSVEFICQNCKPQKIQAEPVFLEGRAKAEQTLEDADIFVEQFIEAHAIAKAHGIDFFYSAARPQVLVQRFCLAACRALVVTTDGDITTCFETFGREHPLSARFIVGQYQPDGQYLVDKNKLDKHFSRTADNIPYCEGCFCRWHCAGNCSIKSSVAGRVDEFQPTARCRITQALTQYLILENIRDNGGLIWQRTSPQE